jgi:hypothetical protein
VLKLKPRPGLVLCLFYTGTPAFRAWSPARHKVLAMEAPGSTTGPDTPGTPVASSAAASTLYVVQALMQRHKGSGPVLIAAVDVLAALAPEDGLTPALMGECRTIIVVEAGMCAVINCMGCMAQGHTVSSGADRVCGAL